MKFTDGTWMHQPGVKAHYPAEAYSITHEEQSLLIHAPTQFIRHRGDTLTGPILTIRISSPMPGVIRVRSEHYVGSKKKEAEIPVMDLPPAEVSIEENEQEAVFNSGPLSAHVRKEGGWELSFRNGEKEITKSGWRGMGYINYEGKGNFMHDGLDLKVGEYVYGLGERFTSFVKNGQVIDNWNMDGGTASDQAYKSVPFYMTNKGYGVLVNETGRVSFEIASEKVSKVQFSTPGESIDYYVIYGPDPKEVLNKLTQLTGRPALPPAWTFGLWLTTSFTTSYDEKTVTSFIEGFEERNLPLHVFHFDCFWMREFDWCNFEFDSRVFPDPEGLLKRLHDRGLKICVWINPYIGQRSKLFAEGHEKGYFIQTTDGDTWQTDQWQPGMAIVDFTNPDACEWYADHLRRLVDMGVDCFKTDFGERIPHEGVKYFDGTDPEGMHNLYTIQYNEVVFKVLEEKLGKNEAALFARSAYASGQRFPIHWGGDCDSKFESMAESLRGGLSLSACGFGYWSHDIGGFEGLPPASIYKRWLAFGLLSSHSRLHGSSSYRVPWNYDEEACNVSGFFTRLKCGLMPYLYSKAVEAHTNGWPMMRAMCLEFPEDPACDTLERQYMLGDSLLVAPVLSEDNSVQFYLPKGKWTHLLTGEVKEGGTWLTEEYDFFSMPLYIKPNTLLAQGKEDDRPDYDFTDGTLFKLFQLEDGKTATAKVPTIKGEAGCELTASREGDTITCKLTGKASNWLLQLVGVQVASGVEGADLAAEAEGLMLTPTADTIVVKL